MTEHKSRHFAKHDAHTAAPPTGISKLKAAVRQTERFLRRDNLKADQRNETERRLESLRSQLAEAEANRSPQDEAATMSSKPSKQKQPIDVATKASSNNGKADAYKMLRHFEYVKTARRVKAANKAIKQAATELGEQTADGKDAKKLQKKFHKENKARQEELLQARTDAWYVEVSTVLAARKPFMLIMDRFWTKTFPKDRKYVSLYPQGELVACRTYDLPSTTDITQNANVLEVLPPNRQPDEVRACWRAVCRERIESGLHTGEPVKAKAPKVKQDVKSERQSGNSARGGQQSSSRTKHSTTSSTAPVEPPTDNDDFFE